VQRPLRIVFRSHDLAVAHVNNAVAVLRGLGIVRNHQHRLAEFLIRESKHAEYDVGILGIQVARGFVGQHDRWFVDESAGQSYPLLLSSGQLRGAMSQAFGESKKIGDAVEVGGIARTIAGNFARDLDIGAGIERGQQIELLEDEPNLAFSHAGALGIGE